eukprot:COSAG01_NODE_202_length_22130_cov_167.927239_10_plen_62_part_00
MAGSEQAQRMELERAALAEGSSPEPVRSKPRSQPGGQLAAHAAQRELCVGPVSAAAIERTG